jgi:hypothetical protein
MFTYLYPYTEGSLTPPSFFFPSLYSFQGFNLLAFASPFAIEYHPQVIEQGRTWAVSAVMSEDATLQFVTSCEKSLAGHDFPPSYPTSGPSSVSVPNATYVASVFLTSQRPMKLVTNSSDVQKTETLSDGTFVTTLLTNGTDVCTTPRLLTLLNGDSRNEFQIWWTLTETVEVHFYNRVPIYLAPGRTHSIIVNTTNFPLSNMIITETTINNKDHAADIAKIYVNRNALATPYAHLHGCPSSQYNLVWKGSPLTQYVVVIPPSIYNADNATSWDDHNPEHPHQPFSESPGDNTASQIGKKWRGIPWLEEKLSHPFEAPPVPQLSRPFFFIWLENTSNFTLNYTIQVTQTSETSVALTQPAQHFTSPYSFAAFYEFSYQEVLRTMDLVKTPYDSDTEFELVFDLTQFQETYTERTPSISLGLDFFPTSLHHSARASTVTVIPGNQPYVEIFIRLAHTIKLSQIPNQNASFHVRLDGVAYSTRGYVFQPMLIRPKTIDSDYYTAQLNNVTQEWVLFSYRPPSPLPLPTQSSSSFSAGQSSRSSNSLIDTKRASTTASTGTVYRLAKFVLDEGMNGKIQAFASSKGFPNEVTHDFKFDQSGNMFTLCQEFDMERSHVFTLWNPDPSRSNMSIYFSFKDTDACLMTLSPLVKPLPKTALVILLTLGSVLALILIIAACYLCARPSKTEFLTASEEEANNIRSMSRRHREIQAQEAGEFHKVPFLVRDSAYPSTTSSAFWNTPINTSDFIANDDDEAEESDGLVSRPRLIPSFNASTELFAESPGDYDKLASDSEYY